MNIQTIIPQRPAIVYPESDGQPMADNTLQFEYIVTIKCGLEAEYRDDPNVFVAGDLFWYPEEGHPEIRTAPDVLVVFNRPKGHRGSYRQWEEDGIAPQVVFEILSPGNRFGEMLQKFRFNERYGVEEYYLYDPDHGVLEGWLRDGQVLREIPTMNGWTSPRLKVRFELVDGRLYLYGRDGRRFLTYVELMEQWEREQRERQQAQQQLEQAQQQLEQAQQQLEQAQQRAERLAAKLRALGVEPNG
jgi:Uma2 family endonuclease